MHTPDLDTFLEQLSTPLIGTRLFAQIPDILFCIKDREGRYLTTNRAFADKLNLKSANDIIGKTANDLFPPHLAEIYTAQDAHVLDTGNEIIDRLEVITNSKGRLGWHLASKFPLIGKDGEILGIASISRDLQTPCDDDLRFAGVAKVVTYIQKHYAESIDIASIAKRVDLSVTQLDRRMRKVFKLSTAQFIRKTRIAAATTALKSTEKAISQIAQECGYSDQSAFTRQFTATVGMSPGVYRSKHK
ncbi:helix-turn-helix domain-containing protein [Rubritalea tangerina]|uniref:Helix-turn-helix domain-containing protein n=1 Tax=Rubritalea tangerina TaxID=430798 RepID=A0ABW4Z8K6_9BACT